MIVVSNVTPGPDQSHTWSPHCHCHQETLHQFKQLSHTHLALLLPLTALHCIVKAIDIVLSPPVRMIGYVSEHQKSDHLIHPPDKKNNPWTEKVSSEQCNLMQIDKYD